MTLKTKEKGEKTQCWNCFHLSWNVSSKLNTVTFSPSTLLLINYGWDTSEEMLIDRLLA